MSHGMLTLMWIINQLWEDHHCETIWGGNWDVDHKWGPGTITSQPHADGALSDAWMHEMALWGFLVVF